MPVSFSSFSIDFRYKNIKIEYESKTCNISVSNWKQNCGFGLELMNPKHRKFFSRLRIFDDLPIFPFTTSETKPDY